MATRQYVGARYVPKFAEPIVWDIATGYEALTIVTYNNTSYTSKKPVPAGTPITNSEYWVATGNYNAQVEQYRQEVERLAEKIYAYSGRNVKDYGAVGDGITDDTAAIQRAIAAVNDDYPILYFPSGTFLVSENIALHSNMVVLGNGVNSVVKKAATDSDTYWIFSVFNLENVTIKNLTIIGDRETHTGASGEWGFGIAIYASDKVTVKNCIIKDCWGDGIYVGSPSETEAGLDPSSNVLIEDCYISYCRRQGISVTCADGIIIRGCELYHIQGTAPQSGIDFECVRGFEYYKDALVEDCTFGECTTGVQVMCYGTAAEVIVRNCYFKTNNGLFIEGKSTEVTSGYVHVNGCEFSDFNCCIGCNDKPDNVEFVVFNCDVYAGYTYAPIRFEAANLLKYANIIVNEVRIHKLANITGILFNSGDTLTMSNVVINAICTDTSITSRIQIKNTTGAKSLTGKYESIKPNSYGTGLAFTLASENTVSDIYFTATQSVILSTNPYLSPLSISTINKSSNLS